MIADDNPWPEGSMGWHAYNRNAEVEAEEARTRARAAAALPPVAVRPICDECRRPIFQWPNEEAWWHEDARFDQVEFAFFHFATLYVPTRERTLTSV